MDVRGHPLIVVNVASESKNAEVNYTQLTELYERYYEKGLRIIGFPCTQFNHQGPETEGDYIKQIIKKYKITFDITSEIDVNGDSAHPLWKYMKLQKTGAIIKGNFTKFLIDKQGQVVARFEPPVEPIVSYMKLACIFFFKFCCNCNKISFYISFDACKVNHFFFGC